MTHLPASVRVYLSPCDMRKSFDSLHALVRDGLELEAYVGHLVVFASGRRDRLKVLHSALLYGASVWRKRRTGYLWRRALMSGSARSRRSS